MPGIDILVFSAPVPSLVRWGLTPDADLVYRTLVTRGSSTTGGLAYELGMSRARVERALSDLHDAGSVQRPARLNSRRDTTWYAEAPPTAVERLRRRQVRRAATARPNRRVVLPIPGSPLELGPEAQHLPTRDLTRQRLARLVAGARHEMLTFNPEPVFDVTSMQAAAPMDRVLMDRGVNLRAVGVLSPDPDRLVPHGGSRTPRRIYRESPDVPMKLIVVDRRVALFPVDPADYERGYFEITQRPVVESLVHTFERHWDSATKPQENPVPDFALSPREEALIALLVYGHTDATAARELQISERSVSGMMRVLMDRVGVENRFQLGVALGSLRAAPAPPGLLRATSPTPPEDPA